jgi:type II secretory pathway component GspD/PulD (secretin)
LQRALDANAGLNHRGGIELHSLIRLPTNADVTLAANQRAQPDIGITAENGSRLGRHQHAKAFFAALSSDSRVKVLASPKLRVVSGKSAKFSFGDEAPVLGAVVVDNGGKATQSVIC